MGTGGVEQYAQFRSRMVGALVGALLRAELRLVREPSRAKNSVAQDLA